MTKCIWVFLSAAFLSGCVTAPSPDGMKNADACNSAQELYTNLTLPETERVYSLPEGVECPT